jgi:hypothetical protein
MPSDTGHTFETAPYEELFTVLLRQFKRPLAGHGIDLSDQDAAVIAGHIVRGEQNNHTKAMIQGLIDVIAESEHVLEQWGLPFEKSLDVKMENLDTWESTAEFLDLANEKINAELRISAASALILALGDARYMPYLQHLANGDYGDETIIARRALAFVGK